MSVIKRLMRPMLAPATALRRLLRSPGVAPQGSGQPASVLDCYLATAPSPQNALDIFKGEWSSRLPGDWGSLRAGAATLFEDGRITWAADQLGGFAGKKVLELGPLEGGHSCMLERMGAAEVVAIEANTRAYLKCLIVKEVLGLKRVRFLCGDFVEHLRADAATFDACLASGVLYHMRNPVELLALLAEKSDRLLLWTHYYEAAAVARNPLLVPRFSTGRPAEHGGFRHTLYRYDYLSSLEWMGFCGGGSESSHWLSRADILACLRHFGFSDLRITLDEPDNPRGPSFCVAALRA
jgi:hypothetical protein